MIEPIPSVGCPVELKSWGVGETDALGHIKLKDIVHFSSIPAHHIALVTMETLNHTLQCDEPVAEIFEVNSPGGAQAFVSYVTGLSNGTVVLGASGGGVAAQPGIIEEAFDLMGMDVGLLETSSSLTFYAMVGHKGYALQRVTPGGSGPNYLYADLSRTPEGRLIPDKVTLDWRI